MSFPRYPVYKDSGIAWLGSVPGHWTATRVRYVAKFVTGWTPPTGNDALYGGEHPWANISDLGPRTITSTAKSLSDEGVQSAGLSLVPAGSLLYSFKLSLGQVSFAGTTMYTNEAIAAFLPVPGFDLGWAYYALPLWLLQAAETNIYGAKLLNQERIRGAFLVLPPLPEQHAIATFLDRETARIDALVAEQERLIELLREKRQAVISHAVTKGLDPSVPMKDSGVEWLGMVPGHWGIAPLKRVTLLVTDGAHISPETEGGEHHFVSTTDISDGGIDLENCLLTSQRTYDYMVKTGCQPRDGDVLFSKDGTIGRTVVVRGESAFVVASSLIIIRPDPGYLSADFLHLMCQSVSFMTQVKAFVKGAGLPRLSIQNLLKVSSSFPPVAEQAGIVDYLDRETTRINELITEANRAITLLQERRSALISAAVTGQIDVRGLPS